MFNLNNKAEEVFVSDIGSSIYNRICYTIEKHQMEAFIDKGVLLGFSGGADSVMLLLFLLEYKRKNEKKFPILCVHVNHGIRGAEAKRDEDFSGGIVGSSSALFESVHLDVPRLAAESKIGIEEAARKARYSCFNDIINGRDDISCIAVAHNATDNIETVLFNMIRGTGLNGLCGIKPVRDNIIRPLIGISKKEIILLLESFDIPYVTDSTNLSSEYSRNYIRNEILPLIYRISTNPEASVYKMTDNLIDDLDYIDIAADEFIRINYRDNTVHSSALTLLHDSVFARVICKLIYQNSGIYPEQKHIDALRKLLLNGNFTYSLPGKSNFSCQRGKCFFIDKSAENPLDSMIFPLNFGENTVDGTNIVIYLGEVDKSSLNVYKFSIHTSISSDIIDNGVNLRTKIDGDAYKYAGITHKLKKVFNDRDIPSFEREYIPVITDNSDGILWVPGLPVRDGANVGENLIPITVCYKEKSNGEVEMFTALKRVQKASSSKARQLNTQ